MTTVAAEEVVETDESELPTAAEETVLTEPAVAEEVVCSAVSASAEEEVATSEVDPPVSMEEEVSVCAEEEVSSLAEEKPARVEDGSDPAANELPVSVKEELSVTTAGDDAEMLPAVTENKVSQLADAGEKELAPVSNNIDKKVCASSLSSSVPSKPVVSAPLTPVNQQKQIVVVKREPKECGVKTEFSTTTTTTAAAAAKAIVSATIVASSAGTSAVTKVAGAAVAAATTTSKMSTTTAVAEGKSTSTTVTTTSNKVYLGKITKVTKKVKKNKGTLPPFCRFQTFVSKQRSIMVLPQHELRKMSRRGSLREATGFSYTAKMNPQSWPYGVSPRPCFRTAWRYRNQMLSTIHQVALQLRVLWASMRWDDLQAKPPPGGTNTMTTESDVQTTELLKRKDVGPFGLRSEYLVRRITVPIDLPSKPREKVTPQRTGLRERRRPESPQHKGPTVTEVWVPEEDLELWEIRQFGEK
ncbi:hypothetical protein HPB51_009888 [Rhipicephalus microplus]|uniref:Uncharacterized protein n=1 Tax=Rhipicephalus microplus TaxID=6941 RepID=A0A9J6ET27_RHIMP|nr:hypothetical protein HPB51_009888 [Rhipicephalus microplus]